MLLLLYTREIKCTESVSVTSGLIVFASRVAELWRYEFAVQKNVYFGSKKVRKIINYNGNYCGLVMTIYEPLLSFGYTILSVLFFFRSTINLIIRCDYATYIFFSLFKTFLYTYVYRIKNGLISFLRVIVVLYVLHIGNHFILS